MTISASLWGGACGSLLAGNLAERFGRKPVLAACALLYTLVALYLLLPLRCPWPLLLTFRALSGLAIGGLVVACPLYLAEIAPLRLRGRIVGLFQIQIGIGVTSGFAISALSIFRHGGPMGWRWILGFGAVPALILLSFLFLVPEEPHWLASSGRTRKSELAAARLGFTPSECAPLKHPSHLRPILSFRKALLHRKYLRPLLLATSIAMFNQLTGVNVFRVYLLDVLSSAGLGMITTHTFAVSISVLTILATSLALVLIDKHGRRYLLVTGGIGICLCLVCLNIAVRYHARPALYLVILVAYNAFFAFSQGPTIWVYLSELFPFSVRGAGQSYGSFVHWVTSAVVIWAFPVLQRAIPHSMFLIFAFLMCIQVVIVLGWYPETKGTQLGAVAHPSAEVSA